MYLTIICKVHQSSSEFQTNSTTKTRKVFQCLAKGTYWQMGKKYIKKQTLNISEHGEVINYTLDDVSIHPVTAKIQALFLTQLPKRNKTAQGLHHEANGDFITVTECNGCNRRKLRMDQLH